MPPVPSWACRGGRLQSEDLTHAQPDGDSTRYLWATLSCTDLATDLGEGVRVLFMSSIARPSARRLHVSWDRGPL